MEQLQTSRFSARKRRRRGDIPRQTAEKFSPVQFVLQGRRGISGNEWSINVLSLLVAYF